MNLVWLPEARKPDSDWFLPFLCAVCMRWSVNRLWVVCGWDYHCTNVSSLHSASGLCNCMNVSVLNDQSLKILWEVESRQWDCLVCQSPITHSYSNLEDTIRLCTETIFHLTIRKIGGITEVVEIDRHKFWWLVTSLCHKSQKVSTQLSYFCAKELLSLCLCVYFWVEKFRWENILQKI